MTTGSKAWYDHMAAELQTVTAELRAFDKRTDLERFAYAAAIALEEGDRALKKLHEALKRIILR